MKTKAIIIKLRILLIFLLFNFTTSVFSQESVKPSTDIEIMRNVLIMDIEGKQFKDVKVTLKSISPDYVFSDKYKVKVTIVDKEGLNVWKKTLKNTFLYVYSEGQIMVGKNNFIKILIVKNVLGSFNGMVREKEGIY